MHLNKTLIVILPTSVELALVMWDLEIAHEAWNHPTLCSCPPSPSYVPESLRSIVVEWDPTNVTTWHPGISHTFFVLSQKN